MGSVSLCQLVHRALHGCSHTRVNCVDVPALRRDRRQHPQADLRWQGQVARQRAQPEPPRQAQRQRERLQPEAPIDPQSLRQRRPVPEHHQRLVRSHRHHGHDRNSRLPRQLHVALAAREHDLVPPGEGPARVVITSRVHLHGVASPERLGRELLPSPYRPQLRQGAREPLRVRVEHPIVRQRHHRRPAPRRVVRADPQQRVRDQHPSAVVPNPHERTVRQVLHSLDVRSEPCAHRLRDPAGMAPLELRIARLQISRPHFHREKTFSNSKP